MADAQDYANFDNPGSTKTAQNPTILPTYDPAISLGDGLSQFVSPADLALQAPRTAASGTITFGGTVTAGDSVVINLSNPILPLGSIEVSTLAVSGDTLESIAARLASAICGNPLMQYYGVTAQVTTTGAAPVISIYWPGPVGNFCSVKASSNVSSGTVTIGGTRVTGDQISVGFSSATMLPSCAIVEMLGSATAGDVVSLLFENAALPNGQTTINYTVAGGNTLSTIASGLATAINASAALTALGVTSNASAAQLNIAWNPVYGAIGVSLSASRVATETLSFVSTSGPGSLPLAPLPNPSEAITVGGTITAGDIVSISIACDTITPPVTLFYVVQGGDTTALVAAGLTDAINNNVALSAANFVAERLGSVITVNWSGFAAGNVSFIGGAVGVPTEYAVSQVAPSRIFVSYTAGGSDTTTDIATALKNAINANKILIANQIASTSSGAAISLTYSSGLEVLTVDGSANGVETATFGGTITPGDVVTMVITDASLPSGAISFAHTVSTGETTTTIAASFKTRINANPDCQQSRITANNSGAVLSITSLSYAQTTYSRTLSTSATLTLTLANTATETVTIVITEPVQTITAGGTITEGDQSVLVFSSERFSVSPVLINYESQLGDTTTLVAAGLAAAINGNEILTAAGVQATPNAAVITLSEQPEAPLVGIVAYTVAGRITVTMTGTLTVGDVVNIKVTNALLAGGVQTVQYVVASTDTTLTILAASIASALNADTDLDPLGLVVTSSGAAVRIDPPFEDGTVVVATSVNGTTLATITGTITNADTITLTFTDANLTGTPLALIHTVNTGTDTSLTVLATNIKNEINANAALAACGITATSSGAAISIKSVSLAQTTIARTSGATEIVTLTGGPTEVATITGAVTETLATANPSAGTETATATTPLAGGAGYVNVMSNFQMASSYTQEGLDETAGVYTDYWRGTPILPSWGEIEQMVNNQLPIS